jgi:hypothetical protein
MGVGPSGAGLAVAERGAGGRREKRRVDAVCLPMLAENVAQYTWPQDGLHARIDANGVSP